MSRLRTLVAGARAGARDCHAGRCAAAVCALALLVAGCAAERPAAPAEVAAPGAAPAAPPVNVAPLVVPPVGAGQYRVCTFSFHTPDEIEAMKAALPPDRFVFTDLSPVFPGGVDKSGTTLGRNTPGWFSDRCRPDLKCDIVVYSGEFAGAFFGDYGYFVTVQELEEASCQPGCRGLFADPREVFLMACNTLATKGADQRTPEEYLHVLLEHGYSHADAERVVAMRYGPLGPSFRESLRRMFMGVPRIYGFSSVAPRGMYTAPRLKGYFHAVGDYAKYLERAGRDPAPNKALLSAFAGTGLVQTAGVTAAEPTGADRERVCTLYDTAAPVDARLRIVLGLLSRKDFLSFVPTVEVFFGRNPPQRYSADERETLAEIQALNEPRQEVSALIHRMGLSVLQMQLANLALQLSWITPEEHEKLAADGLEQLLAEPLSTEVADIGCELSKYFPAGAELRAGEIPEQLLWHAEGYRMLDCLSPTDPQVSERMLTGLGNIDPATRLWATYALYRRRPLDDAVLIALAPRLSDASTEVRDLAMRTFAAETPLSPEVLAAVHEHDAALADTLAAAGD